MQLICENFQRQNSCIDFGAAPGIYRCNGSNCVICPALNEGDSFRIDETEEEYTITGTYNCDSTMTFQFVGYCAGQLQKSHRYLDLDDSVNTLGAVGVAWGCR